MKEKALFSKAKLAVLNGVGVTGIFGTHAHCSTVKVNGFYGTDTIAYAAQFDRPNG